jgi:hypothetical protein
LVILLALLKFFAVGSSKKEHTSGYDGEKNKKVGRITICIPIRKNPIDGKYGYN